MSKDKMAPEESVHKMLEQVLRNQIDMLHAQTGFGADIDIAEKRMAETEALLEKVTEGDVTSDSSIPKKN